MMGCQHPPYVLNVSDDVARRSTDSLEKLIRSLRGARPTDIIALPEGVWISPITCGRCIDG